MAVSPGLGAESELELAHGRVRYRERGAGPPVVFVHGALVNADLWRAVVPELAGEFRCIAPDLPLGAHEQPLLPGADLTPPGLARLVADLLDALELEDVTLVGNDTGGALCQVVVARHPERVGRLVLTNCDAFECFPPRLLRPITWLPRVPGGVRGLAALVRLTPVRVGVMALVARHRPGPAVLDSYFGPLGRDAGVRRDLAAVLRGAHARHTLEAARSFGRFERPVLVAWGEDDLVFPHGLADRLVAAFPDGRRELVPRARTLVSEDAPEALARLVADFARPPVPT